MFKLLLKTHALKRLARGVAVLLLAALTFGPMSGCYAHARGPGVYYESGYYGGYRGRDRYRYYRAPDTYYYRGGGGYYRDSGRHHHYREHHHRHHHGPRW